MNGIQQDIQERAEVIRIDRLSPLGRELAKRYDAGSAATILVLDGAGQVVYRDAGFPDRQKVVAAIDAAIDATQSG